jgi:predicted RNase H-like HicB family nuclease
MREYTVVIERGETGKLIGSVPSVHGCYSQGDSLTDLLENIREVLELCLAELGEDAEQPLEVIGVHRIAV